MVLVIEDEHEILDVVRLVLEAAGYSVITTSSGKEGIQRATETPPDIILMDMILPDGDGMSILSEIRKQDGMAEVPVLFTAAPSHSIDKMLGMRLLDQHTLISKPFDSRTLVKAVGQALSWKSQ